MQIIAKQEYTDKHVSLYEGQIRNISDNLANSLIEKGIVAEHSSDGGGGSSNFGILEITDDDIIACADENNNVKWFDVLAYVIRKKIGIIPSNMAKKQYIIGFSRPYPPLLNPGNTEEYYCLSGIYFQGADTSAKMGCPLIFAPDGMCESISEETQPTNSFTINNILYNFIQLKGTWHSWSYRTTNS